MMGSRQRNKLPDKKPKSFITEEIHQDLLFSIGSSTTGQINNHNNLTDPLTPLHRLRRFKEIRDRNLRKAVLKKKLNNKKMSVDLEKEHTNNDNKKENKKMNKEKNEKITNGEKQQNGEQGIKKNSDVEESPAEVIESNEEVITDADDMNKRVEIPQVISGNTEELNKSDSNKKIKKEEQKGIIIEKQEEEEKEEIKIVTIDSVEDNGVDEEILINIDGEDDVENENDTSVYVDSETDNDGIKILRCSFRKEVINVNNSIMAPQPSTSKQTLLDEQAILNKKELEKREASTKKLSSEFVQLMRSKSHIAARKPLRHGKRKPDDNLVGENICDNKKIKNADSPSVLSPGWTFFCTSTPLKQLWMPTTSTSNTINNELDANDSVADNNEFAGENDSVAVNYDEKSCKLNDIDLSFSNTDSSSQSSKSTTILGGWGCNIM